MNDSTNIEMTERAVLFQALRSPEIRLALVSDATEDWFTDPTHRRLFRAIHALEQENMPVDAVAIQRAARTHSHAKCGDVVIEPEWLEQAMTDTAGGMTLEAFTVSHLPILKESYLSQTLQIIASRFLDKSVELNPEDAMSWIASELDKVSTNGKSGMSILKESSVIAELMMPRNEDSAPEKVHPLTTIPSFDRAGIRLMRGQLTAIVGRPGETKTLLSTQMALGVATQVPTIFFVLEDRRHGWQQRRAMMITGGESAQDIRNQKASPAAYAQVSKYLEHSADRPLIIIEGERSMTVFDIIAAIRRVKRQYGDVGAVFIDQTYNVSGYDDKRKGEALTYSVMRLVNALISASIELDFALVLLQHIKRDVKGAPTIGDIADSDYFAKAARRVIIVSIQEDKNGTKVVLADIDKNTHGTKEKFELKFDAKAQRLDDWVDPCYRKSRARAIA